MVPYGSVIWHSGAANAFGPCATTRYSLASLPRPLYPPPSPPPPPKPPPPPGARSVRVCTLWTVMFGRQGLGCANRFSQLSLPLGAAARAAGVSTSHNQAEERRRDGIDALRHRSPPSPLTFRMLVTLEDYYCQAPTSSATSLMNLSSFYIHPLFQLVSAQFTMAQLSFMCYYFFFLSYG